MSIFDKLFGRKSQNSDNKNNSEMKQKLLVLSNDDMAIFKRHGNSIEGLDKAARNYLGQDNYDASLKCWKILIMIAPNSAFAWLGAGMALLGKDESEWRNINSQGISFSRTTPKNNALEAIQYFDHAIEIENDNHLAWYHKAMVFCMIGQFTSDATMVKKGLDCFIQAERTRPGDQKTLMAINSFKGLYESLIV